MNRQARTVVQKTDGEVFPVGKWINYGDAGFFEAIRDHALKYAPASTGPIVLSIEVRDCEDPAISPAVYRVEVVREARILNPRRDADKHEQAPTLAGVWRRIKEAMSW